MLDKEPTCFDDAIRNVCLDKSMNEKMAALDVNKMWNSVPLLEGKKAIGYKLV